MAQSPLHERHLELGARMAPFAGWDMPIQYDGIVAEHKAVRASVGMFDISHMGEFEVKGAGSLAYLNTLLTNDVARLKDGMGQYTLMLNPGGGVIDDLILYRVAEDHFFLVVNAAKMEEDRDWMTKHLKEHVEFEDLSSHFGAVAVQGPEAVSLWSRVAGGLELPERNGIQFFDDGTAICRTGYTGEDGFEFFAPIDAIQTWFDRFLSAGAVPCGLGARDTLRLEKCFPLNGSDLDEVHSPLEAGLGLFVKLSKGVEFVGWDVMARQKEEGVSSRLCAISLTGKAPPPRHGYEVCDSSGEISLGNLTSGTLSPTLGMGIGMVYLPSGYNEAGTPLQISVRERLFPAEVVKKPFI